MSGEVMFLQKEVVKLKVCLLFFVSQRLVSHAGSFLFQQKDKNKFKYYYKQRWMVIEGAAPSNCRKINNDELRLFIPKMYLVSRFSKYVDTHLNFLIWLI